MPAKIITRVTRSVFEKNAQNVPRPNYFCQNKHQAFPWTKELKFLATSVIFKKLPLENTMVKICPDHPGYNDK
jgi:hypothetical protein